MLSSTTITAKNTVMEKNKKWILRYKLWFLLFFFLVLYSFALDKYPLIWVDEPWLSEPSWNFVKLGKFINLTFTGYYNYHVLEIAYPVYRLLLALIFKIFGLGIIPVRGLSVLCGFFTLVVVYKTVSLIYHDSKNAGLVAALILMLNPVFFQCARQARQEALVTLFIVLGFYFLLKNSDAEKFRYYFICGMFSGLTVLCHYNGFIVISAMFGVVFFKNRNGVLPYLTGTAVIISPWLFFILTNFQFFQQQVLVQCGDRIFFAKNIIKNILLEYKRWFYPSLIIPCLFSYSSLLYLIFTRYKRYFSLINYILIFTFLMWVIDSVKIFLYLNLILPFFAMTISIAFFEIYKKNKKTYAVSLLTVLLCVSGIFLPYKLWKFYPSDYWSLIGRFKNIIPKGSVVIGQVAYWFGLGQEYEFRAYNLHHYFTNSPNADYEKAVRIIGAQYIIYDNDWAAIHREQQEMANKFFKEKCILIATLTDQFYGNSSYKKEETDNIKIYKIIE